MRLWHVEARVARWLLWHPHWRGGALDMAAVVSGIVIYTDTVARARNESVTVPGAIPSNTHDQLAYWIWHVYNQKKDNVTLLSGLQSLSFGGHFNQSMGNVTLPSGLRAWPLALTSTRA